MGTLWRDIFVSFIMGMVIPYLLVNGMILYQSVPEEQPPPPTEQTEPVPVSSGITVQKREPDGIVSPMDMEAYLVGVVLAEMPASFEPEALKAQSVAARTYTAKAAATGGKHGDGSICTDSTCCQAYISEEDYLVQGGTERNLNKIRSCVWATAGEVLTYEEELIEATYFSCSGGSTEDAVEVWGTAYPYLIAVESPGEEYAAYYRDTVSFTPEDFSGALGRELTGNVKDWIEMTVYTGGGSVSSITICGETYTGTQLRSMLGLRSAAFSVDASENEIRITTKGYGHRVGLSQYGADAMAVKGSGYAEILAHYYPGTTLSSLISD